MLKTLLTLILLFSVPTAVGGCLSASAAEELDDLALRATASAASAATASTGKYGVLRLLDGDATTHWASASGYELPHSVKLEWKEPVSIDTVVVDIFARQFTNLYAFWKEAEVELSNGAKVTVRFGPEESGWTVFRFDEPTKTTSVTLRILSVHESKVYLGINQIGVFLDPRHLITPPKEMVRAKDRAALTALGSPSHPIVYATPEDVARARRNAETTEWGRTERASILAEAAKWLDHDEDYWLEFLPDAGACYAYGFTGCPICGASCGTWGGARCAWDRPKTVTCVNGHMLPDEDHPDDGTGYVAEDKRVHYFAGTWNAWVTEQWTRHALPSLAHAYALTGDEKYAHRAALFFDALASIYPESTSGSWDYPSRPPSGRFARPWYQVARNLVVYVEAYDLIYNSKALDKPSLRPGLESALPLAPTPQKRAVGTNDRAGKSWPAMTRRDNVDVNMMQDAAYYCYMHTFAGKLHNGHADYMRGALAVGVLLGIPEYVYNTVESPYSIYAMLANNCDRDGRYYETALGYAMHARELYLTFVEPLKHWRCEKCPEGIDLLADQRMRSFYCLPDLGMNVAGHVPNFGDCAPDNRCLYAPTEPFSSRDYDYAERLHAACSGEEREAFGELLGFLSQGDVERVRESSRIKRWLLYHADPVPGMSGGKIDADLRQRLFESSFLGQKGIAILRDGEGPDIQGVLLRYGPSLNHGDMDDLGLLYYGQGWQLTYEIGYGLGSTHTQVGWASQTVSHTLVTVNEASQSGGSGGSLHLFADLPSLKLAEADSPLSYASQSVQQYRRTVALVGQGSNQYLIDLFRVRGGTQHDYGVGVQSQEFELSGADLGTEEEGSLAGLEHAWGERVGLEGDITGVPNRPYWLAPPGNGYGFFYDMRRGHPDGPIQADWEIGGTNKTHFRVHLLPEPDTEIIVAKAPGLYPRCRNASYLLARRKGPELVSGYAAIMEPYALAVESDGTPAPFLASAERAEVDGGGPEIAPIGVHVQRSGRDEYFFSAGLDDEEKTAQTSLGVVRWRGAVLFLAGWGERVETLATVGAWDVSVNGVPCGPEQGLFRGTIIDLDYDEHWIETDFRLPPKGWSGAVAYCMGPNYSRNTAYRIYEVEPTARGTRIKLGPQSMLLGQGRVHQLEPNLILSDIPHEYARSVVGGNTTRFFDGKLVRSPSGGSTNIGTVEFGAPMQLHVDSTEGFEEGDTLHYYDLQEGDTLTILTAWEGRPDEHPSGNR
jgi:hypothetical protein